MDRANLIPAQFLHRQLRTYLFPGYVVTVPNLVSVNRYDVCIRWEPPELHWSPRPFEIGAWLTFRLRSPVPLASPFVRTFFMDVRYQLSACMQLY